MRNVKNKWLLCLLALVLVPTVASASTLVFDAADDFSITNGNPNGVWTYGLMGYFTDFYAFDTAGSHEAAGPGNTLTGWHRASGWDPSVISNQTDHTFSSWGVTFAPGDLVLDTWLGGDDPVGWPTVRWTAPIAGVVDIAATWTGTDGNNQAAYIGFNATRSSTAISVGTATTTGVSYSQTGLFVEAGDTIDFLAGGSGGMVTLDAAITMNFFLYGDANGDGVVSAGDYAAVQSAFGNTLATGEAVVPEPCSLGLLSLGGLVAVVRRKRRSSKK